MRLLLIPLFLLMIVTAPFVLWSAESQSRAKNFSDAEKVDLTELKDGYIKVKGTPEPTSFLSCPSDPQDSFVDECIYVQTVESEFKLIEERVCTETRPEEKVLSDNISPKCDADGENCVPCYIIEKTEWEIESDETDFTPFDIGSYRVVSAEDAELIGLETQEIYMEADTESDAEAIENQSSSDTDETANVGDRRINYTYLPVTGSMVVAGEALDGEISKGEETFVISNESELETIRELESSDSSSRWGLRAASLFMIIIGFVGIALTLASLPLSVVEKLPGVGNNISKGISTVVAFVSGFIGFLLWILMFIFVLLFKNILVFGIVTIVAALLFLLLTGRLEKVIERVRGVG